ncbi:CitMHS family transporter, partial [Streptococcus pyogenes]
MLLTTLAYAMIIVFMYVVMKKKMTPFTALVMIPLIMTIAVTLTGSADFNADAKFVAFVGDGGIAKDLTAIGPMVM